MGKDHKGNKTARKRNKKDTPCRDNDSCTFGVNSWLRHDGDTQNAAPKNNDTSNTDNPQTSANILPNEIHASTTTTTSRIPKITLQRPKRPNLDEHESGYQLANNTKLRSSGRNIKNGPQSTPEGVI